MEALLARVMATVLGIIALGGAVYYMSYANESSKVNMMTVNIAQLVTEARGQYANSSTGYATLTTANIPYLANNKIIPSRLMLNNNAIDLWGNPITFSPVTSSNNYEFQMSFGGANIPASTCAMLATSLGGYVDLNVGGTDFGNQVPDAIAAFNACNNSTQFTVTFL